MRILPVKYTGLAIAVIMSLIMSGIISLAFAIMNGGFTAQAMEHWPLSWLRGWIVALPVVIIVMPRVRNFVNKITIE